MLVPWSRNKIDHPPFPRAAIIPDIVQHKDIQGASVPRQSFHLYTLWSWTLQAKVWSSICTSELNMGREFGRVSCRYCWIKNKSNSSDSKMLFWRQKRQPLENHCGITIVGT